MMRLSQLAVLALAMLAIPSKSQGVGVEIGTLFGVSHLSSEGESITSIFLPSGGVISPSLPLIYISWFPSEKLIMGSEFSFGITSADDDDITLSSLYLGSQTAFFFRSNAMSGAYVLGQGALHVFRGSNNLASDTETDFIAGAGLGYQWRIGSALVLRTEWRYRRWFDNASNEFLFIFGLGIRLGGADK